jgi:hypothetical protein
MSEFYTHSIDIQRERIAHAARALVRVDALLKDADSTVGSPEFTLLRTLIDGLDAMERDRAGDAALERRDKSAT